MVTEAIDWIIQTFTSLFNLMLSSWATSSLILLSIIGLVIDLIVSSRSK